MKRLRLKCPFCGYGNIVFIIAFTIASVLAFVIPGVTSPDFAFHGIILRIILIASAFSLLAHFWLYRTKKSERELIKNAEKICWRPLSNDEEKLVIRCGKPDYLGFIIAAVIIAAVFLGYAFAMEFEIHPFILAIVSVCAIAAFVYLLTEISHYRKWQGSDGSAKCAVLPDHHTYTVKNKTKLTTIKNYYHVVYTQEGKLVFKGGTDSFGSYLPKHDVKEIRVFEYRNIFSFGEY